MSEFEKIRYTRQEDFSIDKNRLIPFEFPTGKRNVYDNCNLSISSSITF